MQYYYTRKNPDARGVIQVHADRCKDLPEILERVYLGIFPNSSLAMNSAKEKLQLTKVRICTCCME
ncbi:hypothetical protein G3I01_01650 [Gramella sp. MT6]|uniref:hypothetical protein n=1 Tax=Gramella sp. MT6 TaxID=2705471 RepID=UPI001C5CE0CC|nr:hypothetical protein [Gramella sp. MT6]QYA24267.1 hypothetical protein G3I01_01650 [Gramella sp. MT6]